MVSEGSKYEKGKGIKEITLCVFRRIYCVLCFLLCVLGGKGDRGEIEKGKY